MIKHKQTKFIHQINNLMNKIISTEMDIDLTCCRSISQANLDIVNQVNELNWHFNQWTQHKNTFQDEQKQKAKRIYAWSGYFKAVAALLRTINPHTVICSIKPMVPPCDRYFYELLTTHLKHDYTSVPPKTTPFNTHLTQFMRQWTQQEGITVKIEGKEYLEAIDHAHDSTINLFLPSHRSPIPDAMLMSHLDLPHFILFGNPAMFAVPEKMQYWLSWIPETIRDSLGINPENLKQ
jgi:hypothetical protein